MSKADSPFDSLRKDNDIRNGTEELAERDDRIGALARISLAVADGERPDPDDCEMAGLKTLPKIARGEH